MFTTPTAMAKKYGFHRATINRWIVEGKLKAYRTPGGKYKLLEADFRALLGLESEA